MSRIANLPPRPARLLPLAAIALALGACSGTMDRIKQIGSPPPLAAIENPTVKAGYRPVQMPMPRLEPAVYQPNSLWQAGARAFFKDQRASQIGDILTVRVIIQDEAEIENSTSQNRTTAENLGVSALAGFENKIIDILPDGASAQGLVDTDSDHVMEGSGTIKREEEITTNIAAVVTQVLPNGNLVIEGRQEVRVNYEVRELVIAGIVRPQDIGNDNTIDSTKIAEARIAYGGRGHISDVQQARYGQQFLDIVLPF